MDDTINVILKVLFDFALEVWFSILFQRKHTTIAGRKVQHLHVPLENRWPKVVLIGECM